MTGKRIRRNLRVSQCCRKIDVKTHFPGDLANCYSMQPYSPQTLNEPPIGSLSNYSVMDFPKLRYRIVWTGAVDVWLAMTASRVETTGVAGIELAANWHAFLPWI
jgi:hypothetical protein